MYLNDVKKKFKENLTILCTFEQDGTRCHSTLSWKTVLMLLLLFKGKSSNNYGSMVGEAC